MDKKDEKILMELTLNSKLPLNRLAKKVGISREVATYRLNKLIKEKMILGFYTVIDTEVLDFSRYGCFFELKGISQEKEKEFMNYLLKHEFVSYMGPVIGKWNIIFDIFAKDNGHLQKILNEITNKIGNHLEKYSIIIMENTLENFPIKIFGSKKEIEYKKAEKKELDKTDLKILELLSNNSRVEYSELSKKLNMTANAIKYRIKNLERLGIIKGYTLSVDKHKLGYEFYNLQLKIKENRKQEKLQIFLRNNKHAIYLYKYLGNENWDLDIGLIIKDSFELRDFILELRKNFGETIKIHDLYLVVEEIKGDYAPSGVFKNKL
ncbi:AsnC family transcriptional regulator [Candidatus Pacearchaeota archaeon]|nr:AsnC family transcriptional regulator [Candidatus Pacearchaeota archaeon]